jgi:hypothetical protein
MEKKDDYISGPHHYWPHFVCGFVFGAFVGASLSTWILDSSVLRFIAAVITGLCFGLSCGKWGDRAWKSIADWFSTWWRAL